MTAIETRVLPESEMVKENPGCVYLLDRIVDEKTLCATTNFRKFVDDGTYHEFILNRACDVLLEVYENNPRKGSMFYGRLVNADDRLIEIVTKNYNIEKEIFMGLLMIYQGYSHVKVNHIKRDLYQALIKKFFEKVSNVTLIDSFN